MAGYELSQAADRDLTEIYAYSYREFGAKTADAYFVSLEDCLTRLAESPQLGRSIAHIRPGYFRFEHASHVVFYTRVKRGIRIVRVLHQRMDAERHL
jgi:toxin ParE1/3/4